MELKIGDKLLCRASWDEEGYQSHDDLDFLTFGKRYEIEDIFFENDRLIYVIQTNYNATIPFVLSSVEKYFVVGKTLRKLKLRILNKKSK